MAPVVPTYDGPQVAPQAQPNARINIAPGLEAFGGGNALPQLDAAPAAKLATSIYEEERQKADQVAITDAAGRLSALETQILYGQNGQGGALNRQGKDAFTAPEDTQAQWTQTTQEIASGLTNDDQRAVFNRMQSAHYGDVNAQVQRHVAGQRQAYDTQSTDTLVANEKDAAIQNFGDAERIQLSVDRQTAALTDYAARHPGLPDGWLTQQLATAKSATYTGIVDRMLANEQDLAATAFYNAHKDEIQGSAAIPLERALNIGSVRGESQRTADTIVTTATSLQAALHQTQQIQDPKIRDATEERVRRHFEDQSLALRESQQQSFQSAGQILEHTQDVTKIPPSLWMSLTVQDRESLQARENQMRTVGSKIHTNFTTYAQLVNLASLSPASQKHFTQLNLLDYRDHLSDEDFRHVLELQRQIGAHAITVENKATDQRAATDAFAKAQGIKLPGVPGAPIAPLGTVQNPYSPVLPGVQNMGVPPAAWLQRAKRDPTYRDYLHAHGWQVQ